MRKFISFILCMLFIFTPVNVFAAEDTTPSGIPFSQMETKIDNYVNQYLGETTPGAAVAIVKDGKIIFSKGYGYADVESKTPVDATDTVFEYGSISKLFTWTSIMQMVEQGKLDLDTDIRTYLPDDFNKRWECKQTITLRDIMNHASGFGDYPFDLIYQNPNTPILSLEQSIFNSYPQQYFKPGTGSAYSNYATALAGYVVECVSGQAFSDYEMDNIFKKTGMDNSSGNPKWSDNLKILDTKAQGYIHDGKGGFVNGGWSYVPMYPAGSINGTADDLARFAIALTPEEGHISTLFMKQDTLTQMLSPSYTKDGSLIGTAHGFFEYDGTYPAFGHGGNTAAFSTQIAVVPEERFGLVILTNCKGEMNILFGLQDLLIGNHREDTIVPVAGLPDSSEVSGSYVPMERQVGNIAEFFKYLSLYKVEAISSNKITMSIGTFKGIYEQTEPYVYELREASHPMFINAYSKLSFKMKDGLSTQIMAGKGMDLSALPSDRTAPLLTVSAVIALFSTLFFFTVPFIFIIQGIRRRKQDKPFNKRFNLYQLLITLCGTSIVLNNLISIIRFIIINNFRTYTEMMPHAILNYVFSVFAVIFILLSFQSAKNGNITMKRKIMFGFTITLLALLCILLVIWNFFVIFA